MKNLFNKGLSGILNLLAIVLGIVTIVYYTVTTTNLGEFTQSVVLYLVLALACSAVYVLVGHYLADVGNLVSAVLVTVSLGKLAISSINNLADGLNGITMFGSSGQYQHLIVCIILEAVVLVLVLVSCFLCRDKKASYSIET